MEERQAVGAFLGACFSLSRNVEAGSLADLSDGILVGEMLMQIAPGHFDEGMLEKGDSGNNNWALSLSNLRRVVRALESYYRDELRKDVSSLTPAIDLEAIAKSRDQDEILNLMELVVGAAVMCDDKAKFIKKIFSLEPVAQNVLKQMIEQVMSRLVEYDPSSSTSAQLPQPPAPQAPAAAAAASGAASMIAELQQVVGHLQDERKRLLADVTTLQQQSQLAQAEADKLRARVTDLEREVQVYEGQQSSASHHAAAVTDQLNQELDTCKRALDLRVTENETLRADLKASEQRLTAAREMQAKLEMEAVKAGDELDVLRDQGSKLSKAEATLEKYQRKLEELPSLKRENKELLEKMDQYLDEITALKSASKNSAGLTRMVEQYKDRAVELEREKFEAQSAAQMHQAEVARLRVEIEDHFEARRFLEEELANVRQELSEASPAAAEALRARGSSSSFGGASDLLEPVESMASLHEKLKLAEREIRALKAGGAAASPSGHGAHSSTGAGPSYEDMLHLDASVAVQELALARAELDDALRAKRDREDLLLGARKALAESQAELQKAVKALSESDGAKGKGKGEKEKEKDRIDLREAESKLAQALHTVGLLEERLKQKEGTLNQLEQEKDKLDVFARSGLAAFKDKFSAEAERWKQDKANLERRLELCEQRRSKSEALAKTEQRLVMAALYQVGSKIVDRSISVSVEGQLSLKNNATNRSPAPPSTILAGLAAAQTRGLDAQLLSPKTSGAPATPVFSR